MSRSLYSLALLLVAVAAMTAAQDSPAVTPVLLPAVQSSVTTTAFNPGLTNAGGTTNSAGTFNVQSLARSSSFAGPAPLQQTTSYVISDPKFAPSANAVTPTYLTVQPSSSTPGSVGNQQSSATQSSISLVSSNASVQAITNVDGAKSLVASNAVYHQLGLYLATAAAVIIAGVAAL